MKIKDVEQLVGITSANIRYYESQGLIALARSENGYRDYAEADVQILWRVKLLRLLGISIDEIKALQTGEQDLLSSLDSRLAELEGEQIALEQAEYICRSMRNDGAEYATLDAQRYLEALARQESEKNELENDTIPRAVVPWRRYFARFLDFTCYSVAFQIFIVLGFRVNLSGQSTGWDIIGLIVGIALTFAIEPVLLSRFGTTLGKWIMGLRVVGDDGNKLTYDQAMSRFFGELQYGDGCCIPIYNLYRNYKCYWMVAEGKALPWEDDNYIVAREWKLWRVAPLVGVYGLMVLLLTFSMMHAERPVNRGDLTVAQFAENYNGLMDYYNYSSEYLLDEQGRWVENENLGVSIGFSGDPSNPEFQYTVEDGVITGITLRKASTPGSTRVTGAKMEMTMAVLAFVGAQKGRPLSSDEMQIIIDSIQHNITTEFDLQAYGVTVSRTVEMEGYTGSSYLMNDGYKTDSYYTAEFIMSK